MTALSDKKTEWQPSASIKNLLARAKIIADIRQFFTERGLLEVETPVLSEFGVTDLHLSTFNTEFVAPFDELSKTLWLSTSPEYHMKRLLAAGSGPIFQIGKVFRNEEAGNRHNPEFTMLEWYRPHFDMYRLMNEVDDLLQQILDCKPAETLSYQFVFQEYEDEDRDTLLQFLFSEVVEPKIGQEAPVAVYHFPSSQAALAQLSPEDSRVAERFEFYYKGLELANGFHELTDAREQQYRFEKDNRLREKAGLPQREIDYRFLGALQAGIPNTSGVALGVDRLIMIALGAESIKEVISFSVECA